AVVERDGDVEPSADAAQRGVAGDVDRHRLDPLLIEVERPRRHLRDDIGPGAVERGLHPLVDDGVDFRHRDPGTPHTLDDLAIETARAVLPEEGQVRGTDAEALTAVHRHHCHVPFLISPVAAPAFESVTARGTKPSGSVPNTTGPVRP